MRPGCEAVDDAIARFLKLFSEPAALLVAVSGGGDSLGLLIALDEALNSGRHSGFSITACTVDHGLRAQSADEARWVADFCARRGVAHVTRRWRGPAPVAGVQAAARDARHALLADAARETGASAIVTAHNLDDQSETVAMRSARRDDGAGLAGMAPATLVCGTVWVLRPLLRVARCDIRSYLQSRGQTWLEDPSNLNRRFERVRVRLDAAGSAGLDAGTRPAAAGGGWPDAAAARRRAARAGADFLAREVRVFDATLACLPKPAIAAALSSDACWQAFLTLAAVLGGREHRPERAAADRLAAFIGSESLSRITAGRVVFDRRREGLFVYREQRGIEPVAVAPAQAAVWDGRWRIRNLGTETLCVRSGDAEAEGAPAGWAGVPAGVEKRAARGRPLVLSGEARADDASFTLEPVLLPFERYLPVFDLPLADAMAGLFGRGPHLRPPIAETDDTL